MTATSRGPLVSVVIPFRNAAATLARTLRSCLAQTHPRLELILVDNGSTDAGVAVVHEVCASTDRPWTLLHCPEAGVNRARRVGQGAVRGDYLQWLDADDVLPPGKLERQVEALEARPTHHVAYGDWRWLFELPGENLQGETRALQRRVYAAAYGTRRWAVQPGPPPRASLDFRLQQFDDYLLRLLEDKWIPPHGYLLRREAADRLAALNALDPELPVATDRFYFTLAALAGLRFLYVPDSGVDYRTWSGGQITTSTPPAVRARHLSRCFERLGAIPSDRRVPLSNRHRLLLGLDRARWRSPGPSLRPVGGHYRRVEFGGNCFDLRGGEALVAPGLAGYRATLPLEDHAKIVALRVPSLWERHTLTVRILQRFAAMGLLERAD